eukprot:TRINITY_DN54629_c0_g1_i1.p1 TRINITY_DN54629_c0_g1~~TRINITY_DN54629_c0_g1_i1.p1  ORF type:complete len:171 (+),score=29.41 TRINITY_DN54629_c0_g1_i1:73-585(+)
MKYTIDSDSSEIGFQVTHLMWSSVEGRFEKCKGELHFGSEGTTLEEQSFIDIESASFESNMGSTAKASVTSTVEVEKFPIWSYKLEGLSQLPSAGEAFPVKGRVSIRGIEKEVDFTASFDPNTSPGQSLIKLKVEGKIDRFAFDVCSSWPSMTVAKEVTLKAQIVANLDP